MCTDEEILDTYKLLARLEGVFCEPASAASVTGVRKLAAKGFFKEPATVVCILTGHGLKDPDRAIKMATQPMTVPPTMDALLKVLGY
jgi:threonine synthase